MSARRARRLAETQRKSEEESAQRFLDEQGRQMKAVVAHKETDDTFKPPDVKYGESPEEQALKKEQVLSETLFLFKMLSQSQVFFLF